MNFKFFKGDNTPSIFFTPMTFEHSNVEFCFQFGDEDPVVFAQGQNECVITINPTMGGNISFNDNGKVFKLFARERQ
jgi:hypothetical protein